MPRKSTQPLSAFSDVIAVLNTALANGGAKVERESEGAARSYAQRCNQARVRKRQRVAESQAMTIPGLVPESPWEGLEIKPEGIFVIIRPRAIRGTLTDLDGNPVLYDPRFPNDSYFLQTKAEDQQIAWFGEGTYAFTDQYKLTVGARYSHLKFTNETLTGGPQLFLSPQTVGVSKSENSFTPKVSFSYQMDSRNLYYASYAKGFRPGGANNPVPYAACAGDFAAFGIAQSPPTFSSDTVNSFEIGAKNNIDNRIKIASSVYYIRWNNIQQTVVPPVCSSSGTIRSSSTMMDVSRAPWEK